MKSGVGKLRIGLVNNQPSRRSLFVGRAGPRQASQADKRLRKTQDPTLQLWRLRIATLVAKRRPRIRRRESGPNQYGERLSIERLQRDIELVHLDQTVYIRIPPGTGMRKRV